MARRQSVEVKQVADNSGEGVFAKRKFATGEVICKADNPVVSIPFSHAKCCHHCLRGSGKRKLKRCTGCKFSVYCDKECQQAHWKDGLHKYLCPILKLFSHSQEDPSKVKHLPISGVMAFNLMIYMWFHKQPDLHRSLVSNWELLSEHKKEHCTKIASLVMQMWTCFVVNQSEAGDIDSGPIMWSSDEICNLVSQIELNSFTVVDVYMDKCGVGLYLGFTSKFNHSCAPNAQVVFPQLHPEGDETFEQFADEKEKSGPPSPVHMEVHALEPIAEGQEIFISYIDTAQWFSRRQQYLSHEYCFECKCSKCVKFLDSQGNSEKGFFHFRCPQEGCDGVLRMSEQFLDVDLAFSTFSSAETPSSTLNCSDCKANVEAVSFVERLEKLKKLQGKDDMETSVETLTFLKSFLHTKNVLLVELSNKASLAAISAQDWHVAHKWTEAAVPIARNAYHSNSLNLGILLLKSAKLGKLFRDLSSEREAKACLDEFLECLKIFKIAFGEKHPLSRFSQMSVSELIQC
jgi:hypothetical protein